MRILHHISIGEDNIAITEGLGKVGIVLERTSPRSGPLFFEISEDDPRWPDVSRLLDERPSNDKYLSDRSWTEFNQQERDKATCLSVGMCWTNGYPEPSDTKPVPGQRYLPYVASTYDLSAFCPDCLTGATQNAPFRIKSEPAWGRRSILKLNWVSDELFVRSEVWDTVFRASGVECRPVLHKSGSILQSIVQLIIPQGVALSLEGQSYKVCQRCGVKKYSAVCRGFFPPPRNSIVSIAKSVEYFGHDTAFKAILVGKPLYERIREAELKGAEFEPCSD
jgi:hypothetical protein